MQVTFTFHSVQGLPGHEGLLHNKTDPYIEASYAMFHNFKSETKKDAGKQADFEETWTFETKDHDEIFIKVKDNRHLRGDELLAEGVYKFDLRPGFHFSGEIGLLPKHHGCNEPLVRLTCKVD